MTVEDILGRMRRNKAFYKTGGLTVSGGEPMLQASFVADLFEKAQAEGWHTCLDTNGYHKTPRSEDMERALAHANLVMLDIKHMDPQRHEQLTGCPLHYSLETALYLARNNIPARIRWVVVPGWNDTEDQAMRLARFVEIMRNIEAVEILPFHQMGKAKWAAEGLHYTLADCPVPAEETIRKIRGVFQQSGLKVIGG